MSIAYIIFEKQPEAGRPAWSAASAHEFIRDRQADPEGGLGKLISLSEKAVDGYEAVIAKFDCATADTSPLEISLRLVPLSRTVTYAIEDEAALDDFLEPLVGEPPKPPSGAGGSSSPRPWPPLKSPIEQHADIIRERLAGLDDSEKGP